jgi:hypothetical protein
VPTKNIVSLVHIRHYVPTAARVSLTVGMGELRE